MTIFLFLPKCSKLYDGSNPFSLSSSGEWGRIYVYVLAVLVVLVAVLVRFGLRL